MRLMGAEATANVMDVLKGPASEFPNRTGSLAAILIGKLIQRSRPRPLKGLGQVSFSLPFEGRVKRKFKVPSQSLKWAHVIFGVLSPPVGHTFWRPGEGIEPPG